MTLKKILLISDTHIPTRISSIDGRILNDMENVDMVIGLGDYVDMETVRKIEAFAPKFVGVHGNMDYPEVVDYLPDRVIMEIEGFKMDGDRQ